MRLRGADDFEAWKGVATSNGGHVLGAGSTNDPAFVLTVKRAKEGGVVITLSPELEITGYGCEDHFLELNIEIRILKKQNDDLKTKMEDERAAAGSGHASLA
ncbi:hypothetical protein CTI12_AA304890 [Artemisia annua]|uniref:Uncharacterized protein n=1 Tax=Artemisia annua TaxID=35608 RepID=A0A2U1N5R8_ARTAN|nr:hypothetical protein CTI12_AA304890 [Artemisia annua]